MTVDNLVNKITGMAIELCKRWNKVLVMKSLLWYAIRELKKEGIVETEVELCKVTIKWNDCPNYKMLHGRKPKGKGGKDG